MGKEKTEKEEKKNNNNTKHFKRKYLLWPDEKLSYKREKKEHARPGGAEKSTNCWLRLVKVSFHCIRIENTIEWNTRTVPPQWVPNSGSRFVV